MSYLTESDIIEIQGNVRLLSIHEIDNISHYSFDSHIAEYNDFLKIAIKFYNLNISKTFLLFHKKTNELLAYMTFSADSQMKKKSFMISVKFLMHRYLH